MDESQTDPTSTLTFRSGGTGMSEVTHAFRRVERANVRANTSVQPCNCALRSLAQECLQRMKQQLYWVNVRRILWQVAEACTDSARSLRAARAAVHPGSERDAREDRRVRTRRAVIGALAAWGASVELRPTLVAGKAANPTRPISIIVSFA